MAFPFRVLKQLDARGQKMVVQFEVELIARGLAVDRMRARVRAWDVSGNGSILTITATTPGGAVCTVGPAQLPVSTPP